MKKLKFKPHLVPKILNGSKTITWRFFDEKDLQVGDELVLVNSETGEEFAKAEITGVREKKLREIGEPDFTERGTKSDAPEDLISHYRDYYGDRVNLDSIVKIVKFNLIEVL